MQAIANLGVLMPFPLNEVFRNEGIEAASVQHLATRAQRLRIDHPTQDFGPRRRCVGNEPSAAVGKPPDHDPAFGNTARMRDRVGFDAGGAGRRFGNRRTAQFIDMSLMNPRRLAAPLPGGAESMMRERPRPSCRK